MINSENGRVDLKVPDFEKLFNISPVKAKIHEQAYFYSDLSSILDALANQYGHVIVCDMLEQYLKETLKELEK